MEEEFYATVKLISGEELICRLSYLTEEDTCLIHEPMLVEHISRKKNNQNITGFTLTEWIHSTFDDLFLLPREHIITMTECCEKIERFYLKCLSDDKKAKSLLKQQRERNHSNPEKIVPGYVGSVDQTREILEKIFKGS